MAMESQLNEDQYRLPRAFIDLAEGSATTDVAASDAPRTEEFDPRSREFDAAVSYPVDIGHLTDAGAKRSGSRSRALTRCKGARNYPTKRHSERIGVPACAFLGKPESLLACDVGVE